MTDTGEARPPRRRWLVVVLTVSLALNLFLLGIIAGTVVMIRNEAGPQDRFERIVHRLDLKPDQMTAFRHFQATLRSGGHAMREADMKVWTQIGNPATTNAQIGPLLDRTVQNRDNFQRQLAAAAGQFFTSLTPAQRSAFVSQVRAGHRHRGPWLWWVRPSPHH
jgi:uncharacterized membrane protein